MAIGFEIRERREQKRDEAGIQANGEGSDTDHAGQAHERTRLLASER